MGKVCRVSLKNLDLILQAMHLNKSFEEEVTQFKLDSRYWAAVCGETKVGAKEAILWQWWLRRMEKECIWERC